MPEGGFAFSGLHKNHKIIVNSKIFTTANKAQTLIIYFYFLDSKGGCLSVSRPNFKIQQPIQHSILLKKLLTVCQLIENSLLKLRAVKVLDNHCF
jgi:hypothetical protein